MRKTNLILFVLSIVLSTHTLAQNKSNVNASALPVISVEEAVAQYRFNDAEAIINNEINKIRKKKLDTSSLEETLRSVNRAKSRLNATEKVTFIDSLVVPKAQLLDIVKLSGESGQVLPYNKFFKMNDSIECSVFLSQMKENMIYAKPDSAGNPQLYKSNLIGGEWSTHTAVSEIGLGEHGDVAQNYPFFLADGTTLYFAAKGEESIGGYDIFMTRYDVDENRFLTPENIGMPFNSPANDYLFVVDEFYNLGMFATDRNQPKDSVCIYMFIPNETRRIYNVAETSETMLRSFAKINSIKDTWADENVVAEAKKRFDAMRNDIIRTNADAQKVFVFVVNDNKVYSSVDEFKNPKAKLMAQQWFSYTNDLMKCQSELAEARDKYAGGNLGVRNSLTSKILELEGKERNMLASIKELEMKIRQTEI